MVRISLAVLVAILPSSLFADTPADYALEGHSWNGLTVFLDRMEAGGAHVETPIMGRSGSPVT
jgi:hypothetical protein